MSGQSSENPSLLPTCTTSFFPIPLPTPQSYCAESLKPAREPGFPVRDSRTLPACSTMAPVRRLGAEGKRRTRVSCHAFRARHFTWAACREGVSGKTSEGLGGGRRAGRGGGLAHCRAVPRGGLAAPNYFWRVFTSTSQMPFCFRSTKQLEMGFQTSLL